jgi:N-acetylmuramoyl-L-alanine amidase
VKRSVAALLLLLCLAAATLLPASAISLNINNVTAIETVYIYNNTSYVPLRAVTNLLCPAAAVSWENGTAVIRKADLTVTARPGDCYLQANGRMLYAPDGIKLVEGTTLVPVRVLAKALGASVDWHPQTQSVSVTGGSGTIESGDSYYDGDCVYWLARIINAESESEPLAGKIAVGNVVLNRVASAGFPDTIYGVIFDGGQFTPVKNGTIYNTPTEESILAAKLCLDGASTAGGSLFFLNPAASSNLWVTHNRAFVTTIGHHAFYA